MIRTLIVITLVSLSAATRAPGQFLSGPPPGPDSATVRGESSQTRKRLTEIEQQIAASKTADLADELQRLLDDAGDDLISVDGRRYLPARRYIHKFLARLPAATLAAYRNRVDEPARNLLAIGRETRSPIPLHQLLDRYFISRSSEEALSLLGELAFERGEFRTAEGYWRRLTPDATDDEFPYPAPRTDPAIPRVKIALSAIFQRDLVRATTQLAVLKEKHPDASGRLAGRDGKFTDTLAALITSPPAVPPPSDTDANWTTLGGNMERDGKAGVGLAARWPSRPAWVTPVPGDPSAARDRYPAKPPPVGAARSLALHPVIVGNQAFVADSGRIYAFDLHTGQVTLAYDLRREDPFSLTPGDLTLPVRYDADFTITATGKDLFARVGPASLFPQQLPNQPAVKRQSYLVCLDGTGEKPKVRWSRSPPTQGESPAAWEGSPLMIDGRLLAVYVRSDGGRLVHTLAGFDTDSRRMLFQTDLCEAGTGPGGETRQRHELLTRAGSNVVFCSHSGAVVAVNSHTGKPAWALRYPRVRKLPGEFRYRDINPPVAAGGRVFVAPTDSEYLYALDAETGRLLWQEGPIEVSHFLGVADGKLIAAIASPVRGIRGFDVASGSTVAPLGWARHDDPMLSSFGRGLVSDKLIAWPTQAGLFFLRTRDGMPDRAHLPGPHGNLAFANGVLVCATPTEIWCYRTPGLASADNDEVVTPTTAAMLATAAATLSKQPSNPPSNVIEQTPQLQLPPRVRSTPTQQSNLVASNAESLSLSSIVRTKTRVHARLGHHHLLALDRESGRVAWVIDAQKRPQFDPFAGWPTRRFLPHIYADANYVVAFTAYGRRWIIDAGTGNVTHDQPGPVPEFVSTPVHLAANLIAATTGPGQIAAFDPATGRSVWDYDAGRSTSLMGTAPQMWAATDSLFVAVARNVGMEIDSLNRMTGKRTWRAGPAFLAIASIDPAATATDSDRLYVASTDRLAAIRLDTGRVAWEVELPETVGAWTVHAAANAIAAVPAVVEVTEPLPDVANRVGFTFIRRPMPERLPGLTATLYDAWIDRTVPVRLFEPITGRALHTLDLPAHGPAVSAHLTPDGLTVTTAAATYLLK